MQCHDDRPKEEDRAIKNDARRRTVLNLLGLSCVGICVLGVPLLGLALSMVGLAWSEHGWLLWALLGLSLCLFGTSLLLSFRHHHSWGPLLVALAGAGALIAHAAHLVPRWVEWAGLATLLGAWFWDRRSHRGAHEFQKSSGPDFRTGGAGPVDSSEEVTHGRS